MVITSAEWELSFGTSTSGHSAYTDSATEAGVHFRPPHPVQELIDLAEQEGTNVVEPFAGLTGFGGALTTLGPDKVWYGQLVQEQLE